MIDHEAEDIVARAWRHELVARLGTNLTRHDELLDLARCSDFPAHVEAELLAVEAQLGADLGELNDRLHYVDS